MHVLETCLNPTCPIKMTRHCHVFDSYKSSCGRDTTQELFVSSPVRPNFYTTINLQLLLQVSGETYSYILFTNSRENKKNVVIQHKEMLLSDKTAQESFPKFTSATDRTYYLQPRRQLSEELDEMI